MNSQISLDSVRVFLERPHRAVLSTLRSAGEPHAVVVDYLILDDALLFNGRRDRRWVANLYHDARATALIQDNCDVQHWVRISGLVELVHDGNDASIDDAKKMAHRYGDDPAQFDGQHRVTWRLTPKRIFERKP